MFVSGEAELESVVTHDDDVGGVGTDDLLIAERVSSRLTKQEMTIVDIPLAIPFEFWIFHRTLLAHGFATLLSDGAYRAITVEFKAVFTRLEPFLAE